MTVRNAEKLVLSMYIEPTLRSADGPLCTCDITREASWQVNGRQKKPPDRLVAVHMGAGALGFGDRNAERG